MLNKAQIIGRLGREVDLRYSQSGNPVATFTIATDESYTDRNGNRVENTEWHRIVTYGKQAETCSQFIGKGSLVYVEGKLRTRKWQDRDGHDRYTTEIEAQRVQFLDRRQDGALEAQNVTSGRQYGETAPCAPRPSATPHNTAPDTPPYEDPFGADDMPF